MKKLMVFAAALLAAISSWAIGASQEWVRDYVARLNGGTNNVISVDAGVLGPMTARVELKSTMVLVATNSVDSVVTNGMAFVNTTNGLYRANGGQQITATSSAFVWNGTTSVVTNGLDTFVGHFGVYGIRVTETKAKELMK